MRYNKKFNEKFIEEKCDEIFTPDLKSFELKGDRKHALEQLKSEQNKEKNEQEEEEKDKFEHQSFFWDDPNDFSREYGTAEAEFMPKIYKGKKANKKAIDKAFKESHFQEKVKEIEKGEVIVTPLCYSYAQIPDDTNKSFYKFDTGKKQ